MNLANILEHGRRDAPALVYGTETWTYGALRAAVADLAIRLSAEGLDPGDHVGLLAANNPGFVVGAFAALTVGLVVVPLNPQSPPLELTRELCFSVKSLSNRLLVDKLLFYFFNGQSRKRRFQKRNGNGCR